MQLPLCPANVVPEGAEAGVSSSIASAQRVLVVDDNVDAAETVGMLLKLEGHVVEIAHDGLAALEAVESFRPHTVLQDIGLPGMNGDEVARRMRALPRGAAMLLVALTGWGQHDDKRRSLDAGSMHISPDRWMPAPFAVF